MIAITVGLPLFRAKLIGWLALESLCRQVNAPEWELLICEETKSEFQPMEWLAIDQYRDRLNQANCQRIRYIPLDNWIPLFQKWQQMLLMANGKIFMLQAADCFSQPYRLSETWELMQGGQFDWCQSNNGYFYSIARDLVYHYHKDPANNNHPCALNMAIRTRLGKKLPAGIDIAKSVDSALFWKLELIKKSKLKVIINESKNWKLGVDTHGLANISVGREQGFDELKHIFSISNIKIEQIVANEIAYQLKGLRNQVREKDSYLIWEKWIIKE